MPLEDQDQNLDPAITLLAKRAAILALHDVLTKRNGDVREDLLELFWIHDLSIYEKLQEHGLDPQKFFEQPSPPEKSNPKQYFEDRHEKILRGDNPLTAVVEEYLTETGVIHPTWTCPRNPEV